MAQLTAGSLEEVYVSEATWPDEIDHVLVLHCSDPWYREATTEFLVKYLGFLHNDLLVVPGGPAAILQSSLTFTADRARVKLLKEHHQLVKFVGIAHSNCAYYKLRYRTLSDDERVEKQLADLQEFKRYIQSLVPEAEIQLYFAEHAGEYVRFLIVR